MTFQFKKFLFSLFPFWYKENDTYKDINGQGLFERYLELFGERLDEDFIPFADNFLQIIKADTCDPKFLNHIAYTLGNPPDVTNNEYTYRRLLSFVVSLYKIKGTISSYVYFFNILGFDISITEYPGVNILYDSGYLYDVSGVDYDKYCMGCSQYSIFFSSQVSCSASGIPPLSQTILDNLYQVIFFLEPINAKLKTISHKVKICEPADYCLDDTLGWELRVYDNYDVGSLYDDGNLYDNYGVVDSGGQTENSCTVNRFFELREDASQELREPSGREIRD